MARYALINKWNHHVRDVVDVPETLTGGENYYQVETEFQFGEPVGPDKYIYEDGQFYDLTQRVMENIDQNWQTKELYRDYKVARVALFMIMMQKGGFANLSLAEKRVASKWFIVEKTERSSVHTHEEQVLNGVEYNAQSIKARKQRLTACMVEVYNRLTKDQINEVVATSNFNKIAYNYVELGQEGTQEGNPEGLFDYIGARAGTSWETTGLRVQPYIPVGMADCTELANKLLDILVNGNY